MPTSLYINKKGVLKEASAIQIWLNKPFPFIESARNKIILVFSFSVFTYLLLLLFHPFGISINDSLFLKGFEYSVFSGLYLNYFLLPIIFKSWFNPLKWVIKKEIIFVIWNLIIIAIFDYTFNKIESIDFSPHHNLLEFIGINVSIFIIPAIALIYATEYFLNERNQILAWQISELNALNDEQMFYSDLVTLKGDKSESDVLVLQVENFLFATSSKNYTSVFFLNDGVLYKKMMKTSLNKIGKQLSNFPQIIRCHKSYIINKSKIFNISGNARSVDIQIENYLKTIPYQYSYVKENLKF